ncbi:MAG: hypothetical protein EAZ52_00925 [Alphaproteobacteria bacterium]|nr:MAG: hypothetical protein EAZ52_00925 [Alphaproteobacteria bacterium]
MNVNGKTKQALRASVMTLALVAGFDAHARGLLPDRPSVEIRLEALQHLRATAQPQAARPSRPIMIAPHNRTRLRQAPARPPIIHAEAAPEPTQESPASTVKPSFVPQSSHKVKPPAPPKKITAKPNTKALIKKATPEKQPKKEITPPKPVAIEPATPAPVKQPVKQIVEPSLPTPISLPKPIIPVVVAPAIPEPTPIPEPIQEPIQEPTPQPPVVESVDSSLATPPEEPEHKEITLPEPTELPQEPISDELPAMPEDALPEPELDDVDFEEFEQEQEEVVPLVEEEPIEEQPAIVAPTPKEKPPLTTDESEATAKEQAATPAKEPEQSPAPQGAEVDELDALMKDMTDPANETPESTAIEPALDDEPLIDEVPASNDATLAPLEPATESPKKEGMFPNIRRAFTSFFSDDEKEVAAPASEVPPPANEPPTSEIPTSEVPAPMEGEPEDPMMAAPVEEELESTNIDAMLAAEPEKTDPKKPAEQPKEDDLPNLPAFEQGSELETGLPPLPEFEEQQNSASLDAMDNADADLPPLPFGEADEPIAVPTESVDSEELPALDAPSDTQANKEPAIEIASKTDALELPSEKELSLDASSEPVRLSIQFAQTETEVPLSFQQKLIDLSQDLIANPNLKIKVVAYASANEDQKSVANRIALARSIAVRGFLIDLGINNDRISVLALGNDRSGNNPERADIIVE